MELQALIELVVLNAPTFLGLVFVILTQQNAMSKHEKRIEHLENELEECWQRSISERLP